MHPLERRHCTGFQVPCQAEANCHKPGGGSPETLFSPDFPATARFPSQPVDGMHQGKNRIGQQQTRSDIPHDLPDPVPHPGFVAVHWTLAAGGLVLLEGTVFKAQVRIFKQLPALPAQLTGFCVFITAVPADHHRYSFFLPLHAAA